MSSSSHSPSPSSEGSAFPWILDHILTYPGSYEIPLRTMYTLNSAPRAQPLPHSLSTSGTPIPPTGFGANMSPTTTQFPEEQQQQAAAEAATAHFKSCLMTQISHLPSQPCSLPPSFITSFVRRCFPFDIATVDFAQALTALDYLRDLETRRRREIASALRRLGIDPSTLGKDGDEISKKYPGVVSWVKSIEDKERKVEALYTQVYIGLRRWTLINEMSLVPFNKANCIAMLNTLYPPTTTSQPTPQLTPAILASQRNGFFRYIQGVEKNGKGILSNLQNQGKRQGEENGWIVTRETVDKYLRAANGVIDECLEITGVDSLDPDTQDPYRKGKRADSGISFLTGGRPSTSSSGSSKSKEKPLPPFPEPTTPRKGGSTLERIAKEIRKMKSRSDIKDAAKKEEKLKTKSLKKMRSASALSNRDANIRSSLFGGSGDGRETPAFDVDEMKRSRMIWEATANQSGGTKVTSYEV